MRGDMCLPKEHQSKRQSSIRSILAAYVSTVELDSRSVPAVRGRSDSKRKGQIAFGGAKTAQKLSEAATVS